MESYRHVEHACFVYFKKSQKMKALGQKMLIFLLFYMQYIENSGVQLQCPSFPTPQNLE